MLNTLISMLLGITMFLSATTHDVRVERHYDYISGELRAIVYYIDEEQVTEDEFRERYPLVWERVNRG